MFVFEKNPMIRNKRVAGIHLNALKLVALLHKSVEQQ